MPERASGGGRRDPGHRRGLRKIRWARPGRGKRGGRRIIDCWFAKEMHIYLLAVYAKGAKDDLTATERDAWRRVVEAIDND